MNNIIKSIEIKNFRSIERSKIKCSPYNLFAGLNDAGKSNVLKALNLFFNGQTDFRTPLDFTRDFNKNALAKARKKEKSVKKKQLITIAIEFQPPSSYESLKCQPFKITHTFDRYGSVTKTYNSVRSNVGDKKKMAMSRLFNKIEFVYIPALKGPNVMQYLLSLIGNQQLISEGEIESLNASIENSTTGLAQLLNKSELNISARLGLPNQLQGFWQNLSVSTAHETGGLLDKEEDSSNFQIPLNLRGDGIKSKFIPPLLQWLNNQRNNKIFVWGIDEPENSLEFTAADDLSTQFCNNYAKDVQIFATTHSIAFLQPQKDGSGVAPSIFKVERTQDTGISEVRDLETLFREQDTISLVELLGISDLSKSIMDKVRQWKVDSENANMRINALEKRFSAEFPTRLFICEDEGCKILWQRLLNLAGIADISVECSGGCAKMEIEIALKRHSKSDNNYKPKIFRQIDRDGFTPEQVLALERIFQDKWAKLGTYKLSYLPVYEMENFAIILLVDEFNGLLSANTNKRDLARDAFTKAATSNLRAVRRIVEDKFGGEEKAHFNFDDDSAMKKIADGDILRLHPGKELQKLKESFDAISHLKAIDNLEELPNELQAYLQCIKQFFAPNQ